VNAVDIAARGMAARALATDATTASSDGASTVGTKTDRTVQDALDRLPGTALAAVETLDLDASGNVERVLTSDRGEFDKTTAAPTPTEIARGYGFTDAGGTHWARPINRECHLYRDGGIASHTTFDSDGVPIGNVAGQSAELQDLLYRMLNKGGGLLTASDMQGALMLDASVIVPAGVNMDFGGGIFGSVWAETPPSYLTAPPWVDTFRVMPTAAGRFHASDGSLTPAGNAEKGFLFWLNIDPAADPNTWIVPYPNGTSGIFRNIYFDGAGSGFVSLFAGAGSYRIEDIRGTRVNQVFWKPDLYCDGMTIQRVHVDARANQTDYLLYLQGLGDGVVVTEIACGFLDWAGENTTYGVHLGGCRGGLLRGLINGIHQIKFGDAITVAGCHIEGGGLILDQADAVIEGNHFQNGKNAPCVPVRILNSNAASGDSCRVTLRDNSFIHQANGSGQITGWADSEVLDISIEANRTQVILDRGNRRVSTFSGAIWKRVYMAPFVGDDTQPTGSKTFAEWKNHAPMLCRNGCEITNRAVRVSGTQRDHSANWTDLTITPFDGAAMGMTWLGPSGTFYYKARPLYDPARLIGRVPIGAAEVSQPLVHGGSTLPELGFSITDATDGEMVWEVFRGTASGLYDKRCFVPAMEMAYMLDNGEAINGCPWEDYNGGLPAAEPGLNNNGYTGSMTYEEGLLTINNSVLLAAPSTGAWQKGDMIRQADTVPSGGTKALGTVCRTAGAPGTWDFLEVTSP
jgi:hypothetical protein